MLLHINALLFAAAYGVDTFEEEVSLEEETDLLVMHCNVRGMCNRMDIHYKNHWDGCARDFDEGHEDVTVQWHLAQSK